MDLKISNFDLTTKQIKLSQTAEIPMDIDITLSEYSEKIDKVLRCSSLVFITSKQISGSTLNVEGNLLVSIIYCDVDGDISALEKQTPFKKSFEGAEFPQGAEADATATANVISCTALTDQRLTVKAGIKIDVTVTSTEKQEVICDLDNIFFEQLKGKANTSTTIGKATKPFIIDEEFAISQERAAINKILRYNYCISLVEAKIVSNKILVKGNLNLSIFYRTNNGGCETVKNTIPFNQIVDLNGITEDCRCDVNFEICSINLTTRTSPNGECRTFMLVAKLVATAEAICENDLPIIYDLYSKKCAIKVTKKEISFEKIIHQKVESFMCKKSISLPESEIAEVMALWCESGRCVSHFDEQTLKVSGAVSVCIIYKTKEGSISYFERVVDFDQHIQINEKANSPKCNCKAEILNTTFNLGVGGEIEVCTELQISSTVYDTKALKVITEVEVLEENNKNAPSLIAYFAEKGENVWEISKKFLADRETLFSINDIDEEIISNPKVMIIPRF